MIYRVTTDDPEQFLPASRLAAVVPLSGFPRVGSGYSVSPKDFPWLPEALEKIAERVPGSQARVFAWDYQNNLSVSLRAPGRICILDLYGEVGLAIGRAGIKSRPGVLDNREATPEMVESWIDEIVIMLSPKP